ncbi:hypothetical protein JYU34_018455 [Plutella xylostella]|uniref:Uncharacterized protein n=1 Tax=Plutella xylostella TaxID=51655 RepID=A0ABQ7PXS1_PLUXY|nr:hypothetical protein JYU34_018455 [Plutella xylostella]
MNVRSDSECESFVAQDAAAAAAKKKPAASKRKSSASAASTSSSTNKSQKKKKTVDVFGLCNEDEYNECVLQSKTLPSFVVNRVANGNQRRVGSTSGEFYAELKVYARHDAEEAPKDTRWTKALLRLNCYLEEGSPQWKLLHRFVKEAGTLFEDCVPSFYNPDLVKIKQAD